jgi:hypothetical protein
MVYCLFFAMKTLAAAPRLLLQAVTLLSSIACVACTSKLPPASAPPAEAEAAASCGDAVAVPLDDAVRTGGVFSRLRGTHYAPLVFTCPSDEPCPLPKDSQIELTIEPQHERACEFAACRVPYFGTLPFSETPNDPCPKVLWSMTSVHLKTNAGTLDERQSDVSVLANPRGEGFVRFMVESPASFAHAARANSSPEARSVLLDVQLELTPAGVRGQLSALAAPLPREAATELRFSALWTATWETVAAPTSQPLAP